MACRTPTRACTPWLRPRSNARQLTSLENGEDGHPSSPHLLWVDKHDCQHRSKCDALHPIAHTSLFATSIDPTHHRCLGSTWICRLVSSGQLCTERSTCRGLTRGLRPTGPQSLVPSRPPGDGGTAPEERIGAAGWDSVTTLSRLVGFAIEVRGRGVVTSGRRVDLADSEPEELDGAFQAV